MPDTKAPQRAPMHTLAEVAETMGLAKGLKGPERFLVRQILAGRIRADYLPAIDHTVTELAAQRFLIAHLLAWAEGAFPGTSTPPAQRTGVDSTDRRP